jgi:hypothetical protein
MLSKETIEERYRSFRKNEMEFKQYWKQVIQRDTDIIPKIPDFHNWEYLSDAMMDDLPVFQHMVQ